MRRIVAIASPVLLLGFLILIGQYRGRETGSIPTAPSPIVEGTAAATAPLVASTTTVLPPLPAIVPASIGAQEVYAPSWIHALVAVSAAEAWIAVSPAPDEPPALVAHVDAGVWTIYRLSGCGRPPANESLCAPSARVLGLARSGDGTVWAATDLGVFSFDGTGWSLEFFAPVGGLAVDDGDQVWIGGRTDALVPGVGLWLARSEGEGWRRVDRRPGMPRVHGAVALAVLPDDRVWMAHRSGFWIAPHDAARWDGGEMEPIVIPGIPDATPDNGVPAVGVYEVEASPSGVLWVVGYLAADTKQVALASLDGTVWSLPEWPLEPFPGRHDIDAAIGPDGIAWFAFDDGLLSFDGTSWTKHLDGHPVFAVDVAPDGAVWYTDADGVHALPSPRSRTPVRVSPEGEIPETHPAGIR